MKKNHINDLFWKLTTFLLTGIGLSCIFFHQVFLSGFQEFTGNVGDARIAISLLEHWRNVLTGISTWNSPLYFYPTNDVLGYNDGYFDYGLIYSLFRFLGFDWFQSYDLVNLTIKWIGYIGFVLILRKIFNIRFAFALAGGAIFFLLNSTYVHIGHAQLLTVNFLPIMIFFGNSFVKSFKESSTQKTAFWGSVAILLYASWLMTAFYTAYFSLLIFLSGAFIYILTSSPHNISEIIRNIWHQKLVICFLLLLLLIVNIPFLMTYLPKAKETGMHPVDTIYSYAPKLIDVFNVGSGNWLYGNIIHDKLRFGSETFGFTPLLLIFFFISLFYLFRIWSTNRFYVCILFGVLLLWLASIRFGESLGWRILFDYMPGAKAVRCISRFQIVVGFFVVLNSIIFLNAIVKNKNLQWLGILPILLILEQLNFSDVTQLKVKDESWIFDISSPPNYCKSFFILIPKKRENLDSRFKNLAPNIDAMILAERFRLPTLNGQASFNPAGWDLWRSHSTNYQFQVWFYAKEKGITQGLCGLDVPNDQWIDFKESAIRLANYELGLTIRFDMNNEGSDYYLLDGWSTPERWGTWSDGNTASIGFQLNPTPTNDLLLVIEGHSFLTSTHPNQEIDVIVNDIKLKTLEFSENDINDTSKTVLIPLQLVHAMAGRIVIRFNFNNPISPAELSISGDTRKLGLGLVALKLSEQ